MFCRTGGLRGSVTLCALAVLGTALAQGVRIAPTDLPPDPSALLQVQANPATLDPVLRPATGVRLPHVALTRTDRPDPVGPLPVPPALLVYNTATTALTGALAQYNVVPGFYSWDGNRWLRFETGVGRQIYVDCSNGDMGTTTGASIPGTTYAAVTNASSFTNNANRIGGLYSSQAPLDLVAGDRVFLEASGAVLLSAVGAEADRFTDVELELVYTVTGSPWTTVVLARTIVSVDSRSTPSTANSFLFGLASVSSTGYSQYVPRQSWSLMAQFDVTTTTAYRIWVRARRLKAIGGASTLRVGTPNTEIESCLRTEVFRH